jgi:ribosomal protein S5
VRVNVEELNLKDKPVVINRVAKVVKGGKRFSFSALVVVGDGDGWVGVGKGKAAEVPSAIAKAVEHAKKNLIRIPLKSNSIPHEVHGRFGGEHILLAQFGRCWKWQVLRTLWPKPWAEGTRLMRCGPQFRVCNNFETLKK